MRAPASKPSQEQKGDGIGGSTMVAGSTIPHNKEIAFRRKVADMFQETSGQQDPSTSSLKHKMKKVKVATEYLSPTKHSEKSQSAFVKIIPGNPERMAPLVGYFPSRFEPDPNSTKVGVFSHKQRGGTRIQLVVTPKKEAEVDFIGTSYAGEAQAGECCSYGLGIFDKATQSLKIVPIANNKVFRLEPKVQGINDSNKKPASSLAKLSELEKAEKRIKLQNLYGTKKSIRQNKKRQMLKPEDDPDAQNVLDVTKQGMMSRDDLLEVFEGHKDRNTPPYNASATTPQEAYPLEKIISTGEWKFLQDKLTVSEGAPELPWFVCNRIHKLEQIEDEDKKIKLTCILSFIRYLIKFKDLQDSKINKRDATEASAEFHRFPSMIKDKFSSMFGAESRGLSTEKMNLLISYVLVLTLFVDEFQTSLTDIEKDLRIAPSTLRTHYEHLGCKVSKKNNLSTVTLPVPLQFPSMKRKRSIG